MPLPDLNLSIYEPVADIAPVEGWHLVSYDEQDNQGFTTVGYAAVQDERFVTLHVSRFTFTPTQDRFAWLVRSGFPLGYRNRKGALCNFSNDSIDRALHVRKVAA